jgi:hypothetical protein
MTTQKQISAAAIACAMVLGLAACGSHDQIDLGGVKIGMTHEQVLAVAPAGSTLYCRGDGDAQFEQAAQLPPSTSATYCTWATGTAGNLSVTPIMIGDTASTEAKLVFSDDDKIASVAVATPANAYTTVVKSLKDKLGSPDSDLGMGALTWTAADGTLELSQSEFGSPDTATLLLLRPTRKAAAS